MLSFHNTAIIITIINLICKILGFGREIVLAFFFGTESIVDAYLMAANIPIILFGFLVSISFSFTPIYKNLKHNFGEKESELFFNNILSIIFTLAGIGVLLSLAFSTQIISIAAPGFSGEVFDLTLKYFSVSIWTILFMAPIQIMISYLNCNGKFILSNISGMFISGIQLIVIFISGILHKNILIYSILLSNIVQFISLYFFVKKQGHFFKYKVIFNDEIKKAFTMMIPILMSGMLSQINIFIDKSFASGLIEGSIAALNYGSIMHGFIFSVFSIAIITMIYPMFSQATAEGDVAKLKDIFSKGTNIILILFVPITMGAIILAKPAISFVFERGEFGSASAMMTVSAFIMYNIGLLAVALRDVIIKVFYSMKDTKSTLFISVLALALDIIFNIILIKPMGHAGLALGTSLSAIITIPIFFIVLRRKLGVLGLKNTIILFVKSCIATAVMGIAVYFGYSYLSSSLGSGKISMFLSMIISAGMGGIIYFVLMIVLRVKEMDFFTDIIKKVYSKLAIKR